RLSGGVLVENPEPNRCAARDRTVASARFGGLASGLRARRGVNGAGGLAALGTRINRLRRVADGAVLSCGAVRSSARRPWSGHLRRSIRRTARLVGVPPPILQLRSADVRTAD